MSTRGFPSFLCIQPVGAKVPLCLGFGNMVKSTNAGGPHCRPPRLLAIFRRASIALAVALSGLSHRVHQSASLTDLSRRRTKRVRLTRSWTTCHL
ncbi:hypothetical protein EDB84DRAFT_1501957 [Lactarius hengduanensis]|nr:hypothetical protein EDB84DRAFT_1501957 [Lactarius hengduanensis]